MGCAAPLEEADDGSAAPPFTAIALMTVCGPTSLHLPEAVPEPDEFEALRQDVRADLRALQDVGIVERDAMSSQRRPSC